MEMSYCLGRQIPKEQFDRLWIRSGERIFQRKLRTVNAIIRVSMSVNSLGGRRGVGHCNVMVLFCRDGVGFSSIVHDADARLK
jgi:hypothetical protein